MRQFQGYKRQLSHPPKLTMTGTYNILEKLRAEAVLSKQEREVNARSSVSTLLELHGSGL